MKKFMFVVMAMAVLLMGCGKEEKVVGQSPEEFAEVQVKLISVEEIETENIEVENIITENISVEEIETENITTWENANIQYWDD